MNGRRWACLAASGHSTEAEQQVKPLLDYIHSHHLREPFADMDCLEEVVEILRMVGEVWISEDPAVYLAVIVACSAAAESVVDTHV